MIGWVNENQKFRKMYGSVQWDLGSGEPVLMDIEGQFKVPSHFVNVLFLSINFGAKTFIKM